MKRVAEASERGFLDCFALRGVGMDNSGYGTVRQNELETGRVVS